MKTGNVKFTITVCIVLVLMQTIFMTIPLQAIRLFNLALRPIVYATLAIAVYIFMGADRRPVPKAYLANMLAILSFAIFGVVFIALSFVLGGGLNVMTPSLAVVSRSIWEHGSVVVLGALIRYKLIKTSGLQYRTGIVTALTIVLAYAEMNLLRSLLADANIWDVFFVSIFRSLVVSAVASYIAIEGSLFSVILVSFVYSMAPYLMPILPDVTAIALSLILGGLAFATAVLYHFIISDKSRAKRMSEKRAARYEKRPASSYAVSAALISLTAAFFIGVFNIYPVVVLTNSMAGTFERGSMVFVEKVPPGEAFFMVGEGEVIHFVSPAGVEYIHRVVDFRLNAHGEREYITRGDAADIVDPFPVAQDEVKGIARALLPFVGYPYLIFRAVFGGF